MITAQIAYDQLEPGVRQEVDRLISVLAEFDPKMRDFVSAATWMDAIKAYGLNAFDQWHYYDAPINALGLDGFPPPNGENVVWAIRQANELVCRRPSAPGAHHGRLTWNWVEFYEE